jgi:integrase
MTAHLQLVPPRNVNRSVGGQMPVRPANATLRTREYLTPAEVEKLTKAARAGRYGHRDATLILIAYRHGLRAIEVCDLEWSQVEFGRTATLHVRRAKNGKPSAHPLRGDEVRALRELKRQTEGGFVFETERAGPFTTDAVNRLIKRIGARAGFPFPGSCSHASPRLRLRAGQQGARYAGYSGLARSPLNSAHRALHRTEPGAIPGFLARLTLHKPAIAFTR